MHWNGYSGRVGGVGGRAAWDGAILLQCGQFALVACMSFVMPGQKIDASTFAVIAEVPWWAACRAERQVGLSEDGMTTPSLLYRCFLRWWYSLIGGGGVDV